MEFWTFIQNQNRSFNRDIVIKSDTFGTIVGFENHGGRTYHNFDTLGHVVTGYGNNDDDKKKVFIIKLIRNLPAWPYITEKS